MSTRGTGEDEGQHQDRHGNGDLHGHGDRHEDGDRHGDEWGITTAEYAVGTAAGAGLAGLLYKMLTGGFGESLLKSLFDHVLGLLGIG